MRHDFLAISVKRETTAEAKPREGTLRQTHSHAHPGPLTRKHSWETRVHTDRCVDTSDVHDRCRQHAFTYTHVHAEIQQVIVT